MWGGGGERQPGTRGVQEGRKEEREGKTREGRKRDREEKMWGRKVVEEAEVKRGEGREKEREGMRI